MAAGARETALKCLMVGEKQGAWSDGYLRNAIRQAGLDRRDAGLCTRLAYGVIQNRMLIDWHIGRLSSMPVDKMESCVRNCLRLGLYQMLFMDRVPIHAAVNESVELGRIYSRNSRAPGFINGILRNFSRISPADRPVPQEWPVKYSHPEWLVEEFTKALPAGEVEALLQADNGVTPTQAQVNPLRVKGSGLEEELEAAGVTARRHPWLEGCLELEETGDLENLAPFREGKLYVQDAAARLAVITAAPKPGMRVLDACAAPGGKSFAAAMCMENRGEIISCDLHPHKIKLIREGASRLGIGCIAAQVTDGREFVPRWEESFDLVMADVPCSGLGVIRKKPEIRYREPGPMEGLPAIQLDILSNVSRYVRPGGVLLYSTCTLLKRENEDVAEAFLKEHGDYTWEPFTLPGPVGETGGMVTLWPHRHGTDGFFIAKMRRK